MKDAHTLGCQRNCWKNRMNDCENPKMIARRRHTHYNQETVQLLEGSPNLNTNSTLTSKSPPRDILTVPEGTCRDRTNEFLSAVKSMQSRRFNGLVSVQQNRSQPQTTEFTLRSRSVGKNLANTSFKLEKLALLVKRSSMFDNKQGDIEELIFIIKQDITSLNKQIAALQEVAKMPHTHLGKPQRRSHSNSVVVALQSRLATMSNTFKEVLEDHTSKLQQEKQHTESMTMPTRTNNSLMMEEQQGDLVINMDSNDAQRRQDQTHLVEQRDAFLEEREQSVQNINTTIVELGTVFQRLATMVKEQEELVHRIDSNVGDADMNIEAAHTELLKYFRSISTNRWLMIKIFIVLMIIFVFFVKFIL
ncbi:syntaxin-5 isoform X1 [Octopus bimaculoides]|nr:syntaxin-5 isoform X1 [Octopus bimaculoides]